MPDGPMSGTTTIDSRLDVWEQRQGPALLVLPFVLLVAACGLALVVDRPSGGTALATVLLTAAIAAWMTGARRLPEMGHAASGSYGIVFFLVFVGLASGLVLLSPYFGFFSWCGYLYALRALTFRQLPGGLVVAAVPTAIAQNGGGPQLEDVGGIATFVLILVVNVLVVGVVMGFAWVGNAQDERRKRMLAELREAHAQLETAAQENAGLQAQLVVQAREAGIVDERARMAREIHDTIAQGLTGIVTQLQAADADADADGEERERHLQAAIRLARESLAEARRSVQDLRPEPLEDARLPDAIAEVAASWATLHGVPAEVTTTGDARPMRPEVEVTLLRAAQEALANVARHARARRVGLTLSYMRDRVTLDVRDDGVGFAAPCEDEARPAAGGFGLTAMRERVGGVGGTLVVESAPGDGTAISATVPVTEGVVTA